MGFWHEKIFENQYEFDTLFYDGEWVADAFSKRPQWKKGSWLDGATFEWNAALPNGDVARYTVRLVDEGFDSIERVDYRSTRIRIEVLVSPSLEAIEEEEDWAMELYWDILANRLLEYRPDFCPLRSITLKEVAMLFWLARSTANSMVMIGIPSAIIRPRSLASRTTVYLGMGSLEKGCSGRPFREPYQDFGRRHPT